MGAITFRQKEVRDMYILDLGFFYVQDAKRWLHPPHHENHVKFTVVDLNACDDAGRRPLRSTIEKPISIVLADADAGRWTKYYDTRDEASEVVERMLDIKLDWLNDVLGAGFKPD